MKRNKEALSEKEGGSTMQPQIKPYEFPENVMKTLDNVNTLLVKDKDYSHGLGGGCSLPGFIEYTGECCPIRDRINHETHAYHYEATKLVYTLALSQHPLVLNLERQNITPENSKVYCKSLADAKVFKGLKILDLDEVNQYTESCFRGPIFARVARELGAEVYTVGVESAKKMYWALKPFYQKARKNEEKYHIEANLRNPQTLETILKKTGGQLDLIVLSKHDWGNELRRLPETQGMKDTRKLDGNEYCYLKEKYPLPPLDHWMRLLKKDGIAISIADSDSASSYIKG